MLSQARIILIALVIVILFALVSFAQEMNRRVQIQREVELLEEQADLASSKVSELENLNKYFATRDYQERVAREKLNYAAPGEKVILLPTTAPSPTITSITEPPPVKISIPEQWWNLFFVD